MYLYHYYEKGKSPFLTLSDLSDEEVQKVCIIGREDGTINNRDNDYMYYRRLIEKQMYSIFAEKGGKPTRQAPYYMTLEECSRYGRMWYKDGVFIKIPLAEFNPSTISFTYGDSFITFDPSHGKNEEYRKNVYIYNEIWDVIDKYGLPQDKIVTDDSPWWEPTYVEVQIWSDEIIEKHRA